MVSNVLVTVGRWRVCVCVFAFVGAPVRICTFVCVLVSVSVPLCTCARVCVCACVYVWACPHVSVFQWCSGCRWRCVGEAAFCACNEFVFFKASSLQHRQAWKIILLTWTWERICAYVHKSKILKHGSPTITRINIAAIQDKVNKLVTILSNM